MRSVYILNDNHNSDPFNSLLMVNLNSLGIQFNNVFTTKVLYFNNIMVYIPVVGIADHDEDYIINSIIKDAKIIFNFKKRIIITTNHEDYKVVKRIIDCYGKSTNTNYYISDSYNTLLASIVTKDCTAIIERSTKYKE